MYILHIETSTKICSVALSEGKILLGKVERTEGMNHAAFLSPMISELLTDLNLTTNDLDAVSISSGPGSYTGLRVGGSTAKAFAYSLEIPLVSVSTLESLALAAFERFPDAQYALPMIDARRDEVYACLFNRDMEQVWPNTAVRINEGFFEEMLEAGKTVCCGDGAFKVSPFLADWPEVIVAEELVCSAEHLVIPAFSKLEAGNTEDPLLYTTSYLKPPNITQPKNMA